MLARKKTPSIKSYTSNSALETIKPGWAGTPLDQDGLFINHEFPTVIDYGEIIKFMTQRNPQRDEKKKSTWRIPVIKNDVWLNDREDKIVWFGHASFFIQLSGLRMIIDPVFGTLPIGRRFSEMPLDPTKLLNIDYILLSHAHYDHCDKESLELLATNNPQAQILTGLELDKLVSNWISNPIQAAGWYQQYQLKGELKITFFPSGHWANRSPFDGVPSLRLDSTPISSCVHNSLQSEPTA